MDTDTEKRYDFIGPLVEYRHYMREALRWYELATVDRYNPPPTTQESLDRTFAPVHHYLNLAEPLAVELWQRKDIAYLRQGLTDMQRRTYIYRCSRCGQNIKSGETFAANWVNGNYAPGEHHTNACPPVDSIPE